MILNGKEVAKYVVDRIKRDLNGVIPSLTVILVGDNAASKRYVASKKKKCDELGFKCKDIILPKDISEKELIDIINQENNDSSVNGILVQMPLPRHIDSNKVICAINPNKDVDGFHPVNVGNLVLGRKGFIPCTPAGILEILDYYHIDTKSKLITIVGRSDIVGKPMANLLMAKGRDATVTICNSYTPNLKDICKQSDIIISACGKPLFINEDYINNRSIIIDVGINVVNDDSNKGYHIVGDCDFDNIKDKVRAITPVPGGVGPMTIAMLMKNTKEAYNLQLTKFL